jgi:hypothetical protein
VASAFPKWDAAEIVLAAFPLRLNISVVLPKFETPIRCIDNSTNHRQPPLDRISHLRQKRRPGYGFSLPPSTPTGAWPLQ